MNYSIAIHKDKHSDYGVTVPDLPGCFSAGSTVDEAMVMAREAIELHLQGLIEEGQSVPEPSPVDHHQANPDFAGAVLWAIVPVDLSRLPLKAQRINITMPQQVLASVDRFAAASGETRSGLLTRAVSQYMASQAVALATPRPLKKKKAHRRRANLRGG